MPVISANGIDIAYDDRGNRNDPAKLELANLSMAWQLVPDAHSKTISVLNDNIVRLEFLLHRLATGVQPSCSRPDGSAKIMRSYR